MPDVYSIDEIKMIVSDVARQYGVKKLPCLALLRDRFFCNKNEIYALSVINCIFFHFFRCYC